MSSLRRRLAVTAASIAIALLLGEVLARVLAARSNATVLENALAGRAVPAPGVEARLGDIVQLSDNELIVYELRPGLRDVTFKSRLLSTNSAGFRGPEIPPAGPRTRTLVGIGDSVMFGHGVGDGQSYLGMLRKQLRRDRPGGAEWRVVNTGVPGYNTVMEVETLARKVLDLAPDVVVLGLVHNDLALPVYVRAEARPTSLARSFLLDALLARTRAGRAASGALAREGLDPRLAHQSEVASDEDDRFSALVGWDAFIGALDRLEELRVEHGFEVIVLTTVSTPLGDELLAEALRRPWRHADVLPAINEVLIEEQGAAFDCEDLERYARSSMVVNRNNIHPSPKMHRLAAEVLKSMLPED